MIMSTIDEVPFVALVLLWYGCLLYAVWLCCRLLTTLIVDTWRGCKW